MLSYAACSLGDPINPLCPCVLVHVCSTRSFTHYANSSLDCVSVSVSGSPSFLPASLSMARLYVPSLRVLICHPSVLNDRDV